VTPPTLTGAHPRSRGENKAQQELHDAEFGSSPLTRGKLMLLQQVSRRWGLIPAHAGKTFLGVVRGPVGGAHPRSRGENSRAFLAFRLPSGSSPLTRGKHYQTPAQAKGLGLIPAHAGKTAKNALKRSLTPGSSPLTRGKQGRDCDKKSRIGLIPAHAGKTNQSARRQDRTAAHPRSRGENTSPS